MILRLLIASCLCVAAAAAEADAAAPDITAARADRMTAACMAYARAHNGAVNIWIYNRAGEVVHFERMDGAPAIGAPAGIAGFGAPFGVAGDPNAFDPADPGNVAVLSADESVGRVRVAGMGPAGDRACAQAAAAAAR